MGYRQYCLDFRRKQHALPVVQHIQRLDADAVAHQVHRVLPGIINGNGKHAVQFADKTDPFTLIQPQNHFGVRCGFKLHALGAQLIGQLDKVKNLSVLHDCNLPVITDKRLMSAANVNDGQAPVTYAHAALRLVPDALVIWPAMNQLLRHGLQRCVGKRRATAAPVPKYAAHQLPPLPLRRPSVSHKILMSSQALCSRV